MKWVVGGPELPPKLLQLVEDGRLVFFCGAGISRPCGLPDFKGLVEAVFERTHQSMVDLEREAFDNGQYDRVLGLVESRIGAEFVRKAVVGTLHLDPNADLPTHSALIDLARTRDGTYRLVTTNFDRGFEFAARGAGVTLDAGPRLPVPKPGAWNSIVHLHGRISDADPEGRSLVLTTADFGAAYLTERWASRFLTELFRRFSVLFVGYSLNDPVVRYMMDALAADRAAGDVVGEAFVLDGCTEAAAEQTARAWNAKGVIPLLYDSRDNHAALHETLVKWAACHRRGLLGKESIVQELGGKSPTRPFDQDPVVSQVVWAMREESAHVASVFARLDPPPPVEWLRVFQEQGLLALRCAPSAAGDDRGWTVPLVDSGERTTSAPGLNPITAALGEWLARHLDKPAVLDWVLRSGSALHPEFRSIIRRRLAENPNMPAALRQLWKVLASEAGFIQTNVHFSSDLCKALKSGEWDIQLKLGILNALSPVLELRPSIHPVMFPDDPRDEGAISHFAEADVVPQCGDSARRLLDAISKSPRKQQILTDLADDVTSLLKQAMLLFEMVQKAGPLEDLSYIDQPSIAPHSQNSGFCTWTVLLELNRDAWIALRDTDALRARRLVERWRTLPYPVFRRLCFFAMAESNLYSPQECVAYLLEDDGWWLWSIYVYREKFRLLNRIWPNLGNREAEEVLARIVSGPPRSMFRDDLSDEEFRRIADREVWLHLSKLPTTERTLPKRGRRKLMELTARYPEWRIEDEDRCEFPMWIEGGVGEAPVEKQDEFVNLADDEVIKRLGATPLSDDDLARWRHLAKVKPTRACDLLAKMAGKNAWKGEIWRAALETFRIQKQTKLQWPTLASILARDPDSLLKELRAPLAWCLKEVAEEPQAESKPYFWEVWDGLQPHAFCDAPEDVTDAVTAALNTPSGHLTQALLDYVASARPQRASDLPDDVWRRLTLLLRGEGQSFKLARVLLASRLAWFYSLNPAWVEEHFLPYFDWNQSPEAPGVWQGYLWSARITPELWPRIKPNLLAALRERHQLGRAAERICELFGMVCVNRPEWFTKEETRDALRSLDARGRAVVARVISERMEAAGAQSEALWNDLIGPWLDSVWPKDLDMRDPDSSLNLAMAATYSGTSFKAAVDVIAPLLVPARHCSRLWQRLLDAGIPSREPQATLKLVGAIVDKGTPPDPRLRDILNQIQAADPAAAQQPEFGCLTDYLRRHNQ